MSKVPTMGAKPKTATEEPSGKTEGAGKKEAIVPLYDLLVTQAGSSAGLQVAAKASKCLDVLKAISLEYPSSKPSIHIHIHDTDKHFRNYTGNELPKELLKKIEGLNVVSDTTKTIFIKPDSLDALAQVVADFVEKSNNPQLEAKARDIGNKRVVSM
jgi:hypothetical protein